MDRFEAGLVLTGTEVKAARDGKVQLKDALRRSPSATKPGWSTPTSASTPTATGKTIRRCATGNSAAPQRNRQAAGENARKGPGADPDQNVPEERAHQVRTGPRERQKAARQARSRPGARGRSRSARRHRAATENHRWNSSSKPTVETIETDALIALAFEGQPEDRWKELTAELRDPAKSPANRSN